MSVLAEVQRWYASNCDGEWEEECGVRIDTLDNPGWSVTVDLFETNLDGKDFQRITNHDSEESWIACRVENRQFLGFGDPTKLEEILRIFVDWAKSQNENWLKPPAPMSNEERQKFEDEALFVSLGDEVDGENCHYEGCTQNRIRYSVMCRAHHFEMVTKRPVPQRAN